jgi:hypothetical protein
VNKYDQLLDEIKIEFPKFKIVQKTDSNLMVVIALFLKILTFGKNKEFLTTYITTIGNTIYVPDDWNFRPWQPKYIVIRHERIHLRQSKKYGSILFSLIYLFFPIPFLFAYGRAKLEWEAYEESLRTEAELFGVNYIKQDKVKDFIFKQFTTSVYLWMFPFKSTLNKWYQKSLKNIEFGP